MSDLDSISMTTSGHSQIGDFRAGEDRSLAGAKCLVLGGGGFIGTNLCSGLVAAGARVTAFGHKPRYRAQIEAHDYISANLSSDASLRDAVASSEYVFHLVGGADPTGSNEHPARALEQELSRSLRLMRLCYEAKCRLIFTSSGGTVYGHAKSALIGEEHATDPTSAYGVAKLCIEKSLFLYRELFGLDYVILRLANPYGRFQSPNRGQGIIPKLITRGLARQPIEVWGEGTAIRDYLHVQDVVEALIAASTYQGSERLFNVGSGIGRSISDLIDSVESLIGHKLERRFKPAAAGLISTNILNPERALQELNWAARIDWSDGLRDTRQWLESESHP